MQGFPAAFYNQQLSCIVCWTFFDRAGRLALTTVWVPACRVALVAAFLVSPFGAAERTWKPFNPVLGETFEADKLQNDAFFVAEQVCSAAAHWYPESCRAHSLITSVLTVWCGQRR
jgi:hypothetical protein